MATAPGNATDPRRPGTEPQSAVERFRRSRRSELAIWWREIDRSLLLLLLVLMATGTIAVAAGSPASARRLSTEAETLHSLHFFFIHLRWQFLGLMVLLVTSMMTKDLARRVAILSAAVMLGLLFLVPIFGFEVNGARRWLNLGFSLQPSEFLKSGFVVATAWMLSWRMRDPSLPVFPISGLFLAIIAVLLMLQPNFGSMMLFAGAWLVLVVISGVAVRAVFAVCGAGLAVIAAAYLFYENARNRIDAFFGGGAAFDQVDLAQRTLMNGGWGGTGFWLGNRKYSLPEAHTDYVFSVIGEEFGLIACAIIVLLYLAIITRATLRLVNEEDMFTVLAGGGLAAMFGGQAFINILVNLQLFPSKGMTLPLVSYGGSSTLAICFGMGLLLAITRRNPFLERARLSLDDLGRTK